jgi:hypothetical protein
MTTDERGILDALIGRRSSITQADLAFGLQMPLRTLQECIESLRLAGHPIVSGSDGMRLSDDPDEVAACPATAARHAVPDRSRHAPGGAGTAAGPDALGCGMTRPPHVRRVHLPPEEPPRESLARMLVASAVLVVLFGFLFLFLLPALTAVAP